MRGWAMGGAVTIGVLVMSATAKGQTDQPRTVRVLVLNQANVPDVILKQAQLEATRIVSPTGAAVRWTTRMIGEAHAR